MTDLPVAFGQMGHTSWKRKMRSESTFKKIKSDLEPK
jgi:hypothetical protein